VARLGEDLGLPLHHTLDDATTLGQDRALNAIGAFARAGQACVIVDAGTAITVDFIDGVGTFHGGMIAPGLNMMLRALHEQTAALPKIELADPGIERGVYGKDTAHAMLLGVMTSARGLLHAAIDKYAEAYGAYPQVIATGGDAAIRLSFPKLEMRWKFECCERLPSHRVRMRSMRFWRSRCSGEARNLTVK